MIRYTQLKEKYNTHEVIKGRKKKPVLYSDDILTFDIEVTSAWMKDGKLIPYEPGHDADYWNDCEKYALPYIWQFSFNDHVYYGRDIREFEHVLEDLPKDIQFVIYVHNLAYEFSFLINFLAPLDVFATAPHKVLKCTFERYENITFKCSYILTNLSLDLWGKQLGFPKSHELDYRCMRSPNTPLFDFEYDYAERDCLVVYKGIQEHLKIYGHIEDIPLTSTGKVRREFKELVTADPEYMRQVRKLVPESADFYRMLKFKLFQGGYTHGNRRFVGKLIKDIVYHKDIASSYPAVMCAYKFPYTKWAYIGKKIPDPKFYNDRAYIMKLNFKKIECISWNSYITSSKCNGSGMIYDNGRVLKADELHITITEQDFITICNNYKWEEVESEGTYVSRKKYLPKIFIEFILKLYNEKTMLKGFPAGSPEADRYAISKQYINSLFGMSVTSLFQAKVNFDNGEWSVEDLTKDYVDAELNKLRMPWNDKYFLSYSVGVWITAYARRRLWQMIESIDDDLIYCDTDSIFYVNKHNFDWFDVDITEKLQEMCEHYEIDIERTRPKDTKGKAHPLGVLDDEPIIAEGFKTLGAKKYIEGREGKLFLTVAGINKAAVDCLDTMEDFREGFIFDKDDPSVHKLEHAYLDNMKPVKWIDNFVSYGIKYGINMRPTGYKLSIPNVIDRLESFINGDIFLNNNYYKRRRGDFK